MLYLPLVDKIFMKLSEAISIETGYSRVLKVGATVAAGGCESAGRGLRAGKSKHKNVQSGVVHNFMTLNRCE